MPNIPNAMRGFGQQVKSGFLGSDQKFNMGDLKPVAQNIAKFGVLGGGIKSIYDAFQSGKDTGNTTARTDLPWSWQTQIPRSTGQTTSVFDLQNSIPNIDSAISSQFQSQPQSSFTPQIPKGDYGTTVFDLQNTIAPMENSGLSYSPDAGIPQEQQAKVTPTKQPVNQIDYSALPAMSTADNNRIKMSSEVANYINDPSSRQIGYTSIAQRFDPLAGHYRFIEGMNKAKFRNDINPQASYEDDLFQKEMAKRVSMMYR
jgi:hypothetical protein